MQNNNRLLKLQTVFAVLHLIFAIFTFVHCNNSVEVFISDSNVVIETTQENEVIVFELREATHRIFTIDGSVAKVRSCAYLACGVVAKLPIETEVNSLAQVKGQSIGGVDIWHRIDHEGVSGYVFGRLVRKLDRIA